MTVTCPSCGYSKEIDDGRLPAGGGIAACPRCRTSFRIEPAPAPAGAGSTAPLAPAAEVDQADQVDSAALTTPLAPAGPAPAVCPSCTFSLAAAPGSTSCPRCGLIFAKYRCAQPAGTAPEPAPGHPAPGPGAGEVVETVVVPDPCPRWLRRTLLAGKLALAAALLFGVPAIYYHPSLLTRASFKLRSLWEKKEPPRYWVRTLGSLRASLTASCATLLADGSLLVIGDGQGLLPEPFRMTAKNVITLLEPSGAIRWSKACIVEEYTRFTRACATPDGGFVVAISNNTFGGLAKFDGKGDLVWKYLVPFAGITDVTPVSDGGVAFAGTWHDENGPHLWTGLLSGSGTLIWKAGLGAGMSARIEECPDHGFIVSAVAPAGSFHDMLVVKLGNTGLPVWTRRFANAVEDCLARSLKGGGYLVGGTMQHRPYYFDAGGDPFTIAFLLRLDEEGNVLWHNLYGTSGDNGFSDFRESEDGSILVLGRRIEFREQQVAASAPLLRVDPQGEILWQKGVAVRGNGIFANQILPARDGLLLVGGTLDFGPGWKTFLVKLAADGATAPGLERTLEAAPGYQPRPFPLQPEREPLQDAGSTPAELTVEKPVQIQQVPLSTTLVTPSVPRLAVFAQQWVTKSELVEQIRVFNVGAVNLSVGKVAVEGWHADQFALTGSCGRLSVGEQCTLQVKSRRGADRAELAVYSDDPDQPVVLVPVGKTVQ